MKEGFPMIGGSVEKIIEHGAAGIAEGISWIPPELIGIVALAFIAKWTLGRFFGKRKQQST